MTRSRSTRARVSSSCSIRPTARSSGDPPPRAHDPHQGSAGIPHARREGGGRAHRDRPRGQGRLVGAVRRPPRRSSPRPWLVHPPLEGAEPIASYAGLRPAGRGVNYAIGRSTGLSRARVTWQPYGRPASARRSASPSTSAGWWRSSACRSATSAPSRGEHGRPGTVVAADRRAPGGGMSRQLLLGIDEGTSAVKAVLYDADLTPLAGGPALETTRPSTRRVGWSRIREDVMVAVVGRGRASCSPTSEGDVAACGLDHQGESVLAWEAERRRAAHPDHHLAGQALAGGARPAGERRRRRPRCASGAACRSIPISRPGSSRGCSSTSRRSSGALAAGTLRLGTVDSWLCDMLGARASPPTPPRPRARSSRCRGRRIGIPNFSRRSASRASACRRSVTAPATWERSRHPDWARELPLRAQVVDQQAALAGAGCDGSRPGEGDLRHRSVRARARGRATSRSLGGRLAPHRRLAGGRARRVRARRRCVHRRRAARVAQPRPRARPRIRPPSPRSQRRWRTAPVPGSFRRSRDSVLRGGGPGPRRSSPGSPAARARAM